MISHSCVVYEFIYVDVFQFVYKKENGGVL